VETGEALKPHAPFTSPQNLALMTAKRIQNPFEETHRTLQVGESPGYSEPSRYPKNAEEMLDAKRLTGVLCVKVQQ
jgi:hypothetical protein